MHTNPACALPVDRMRRTASVTLLFVLASLAVNVVRIEPPLSGQRATLNNQRLVNPGSVPLLNMRKVPIVSGSSIGRTSDDLAEGIRRSARRLRTRIAAAIHLIAQPLSSN